MDIIHPKDVAEEDKRSSIRRFLETDSICIVCGAIINTYWEDKCIICNCGETRTDNFITGKVGINLRLLLRFHIEELRAISEMHGVSTGKRAKMVVGILRDMEENRFSRRFDNRIDEWLVIKIIARNRRCFWFVKDIENAMVKVRSDRVCNIKLVDEKDTIDNIES